MKFLLLFLLSSTAFAKILPDNDLWKEDSKHRKFADLTEERFLELSNQVIDTMAPFAAVHGKTLMLDPLWDSTEVNAYAYPSEDRMMIEMHGGLARRPEVTEDGFQLVVCHEVGHHLAGFALYDVGGWAASEGQSDYYASHVCAKEIWKEDIAQNAMYKTIASDYIIGLCDESYDLEDDRNLCYRTAMAGKSLATLLAFGDEVFFEDRDTNKVDETYTSHPAGQCRLDTYVSGGLCTVEFNKEFIPQTEEEARETSCMSVDGYSLETRPRCWFAPKLIEEGFSFVGIDKGNGIFGLDFKDIPTGATHLRIYWGHDAFYPFTEISLDDTKNPSWGFGDKRDIKVEAVDADGKILEIYQTVL